jgi:DNA replication protein DnaC
MEAAKAEKVKTWAEVIASNNRFRRLAVWSGVPIITWQTHRLYNFIRRSGTERAHQATLDFIAGKVRHHFLTFVGETGRGKTHLALGIAWHWLENDMGLVKYYQVASLLDDLRQGYNVTDPESQNSFDELMKWLKKVDLLIIDDLGVEKLTEWVAEKLDEIVDHRYLNQGKTVFATNLSPKTLSSRGEQRLASRMMEGVVEVLKCEDYRPIKASLHQKVTEDT